MRIAAIQMRSTSDKQRNMRLANKLLIKAVEKGARLVAFPENFSIFTDCAPQYLRESETTRGPTVQALCAWSRQHQIWILAGSLPLHRWPSDKRVTNSCLMISPQGEVTARYDKIHLFDACLPSGQVYEESREVRPGRRVVLTPVDQTKVGLSICYDLRFPELFRRLSHLGAKILFIPAAFTAQTGKFHWDALTRARAIENQAYVIAPAQHGQPFLGKNTYGHTRIINPWGEIIAEKVSGDGFIIADINLKELESIRASMPVLKHRRDHLF